jgi:hypothetical protein
MHQVTIHITITDSTPRAVAAIINDAGDHPGHTTPDPGGQPQFSDLTQAPIRSSSTTMEIRGQRGAAPTACAAGTSDRSPRPVATRFV